MPDGHRHLSMLRSYTAADVFTIGSAACGTIAIFLCLDYLATDVRRFLWIAFILLPLALVLDVCDGYVARLNSKRQSILGADLDSLSDVISFGVAPAVLGFMLGLRGGWDMFCLTPTSILIVALLGVAFGLDRIEGSLWLGSMRIGPALLHPLALIFAASGSAMISGTLRVPKP